jgi:hypothetical protein
MMLKIKKTPSRNNACEASGILLQKRSGVGTGFGSEWS